MRVINVDKNYIKQFVDFPQKAGVAFGRFPLENFHTFRYDREHDRPFSVGNVHFLPVPWKK